jgi:hypothetical protein
VAQLQAAAQPFKPRIMPIAQRRAVPMSTPMPTGRGVPLSMIGLGNLPPGQRVTGNMPGLGNPGGGAYTPISGGGLGSNGGGAYNPGTSPITHGQLGPGGTSSNFGPLGALAPFITAITDWAQQVTDAIGAITDTISADGMAVLWAVDQYLGPYTEPLQIWRPEWRPMAVIAGRIQDSRAWTSTVLTGGLVHWDPSPSGDALTVKSIDGMTRDDGHTYLITFLYFGIG